jgi:hypothetical protein
MADASPYADLPPEAFWASTAARRAAHDTRGFYRARFRIDRDKARIATAGSCFAQHVGRALTEAGYKVIDRETLPPIVPRAIAGRFGYGMYSARYGNIYTIRQMRQLLEEAFDRRTLAEPVWTRNGRFHDAQRPGVDPDGLDTAEEVLANRAFHLARVREVFSRADVFVFTFGLTEAWMSADRTTVWPTAPGTIAGSHDPARHVFHNFGFGEILADFEAVRARLLRLRPHLRFLVTVSPVPLTATASDAHVEVATSRSKSILRAVCAELCDAFPEVDYFPSYEIITAQCARASFYEANLRSVSAAGVATAMQTFLVAQGALPEGELDPPDTADAPAGRLRSREDVVCEDMLLDGFATR